MAAENRERGSRLQRYETVDKRLCEAHLVLMRQDAVLKDHLKDQLVEDPVAKIHFPKYLATSTLESHGRTYYFVGEDKYREFEKQSAVT
jgi:YHS domain-containing protein